VVSIEILLGLLIAILAFGGGYWLNKKLKPLQEETLNAEVRDKNRQLQIELAGYEQEEFYRQETLRHLKQDIQDRQVELEEVIKQESSLVETIAEQQRDLSRRALSAYVDTLEFSYQETEQEFDAKVALLEAKLEKMKSARLAGVQAALREREIRQKQDFYKIAVSDADLDDVLVLESIKPSLRKPEVLSKLIWTTYYQKNTTTMCNNVVGAATAVGIYKITDIETGLVYIGQSVDISKRWKDHIKSALGAGATVSNNKLYAAMRENGVHNFTFEILERVPTSQLNEKEKYWIEFYDSGTYGLNTTRGNG
jgi:hypothetical protein